MARRVYVNTVRIDAGKFIIGDTTIVPRLGYKADFYGVGFNTCCEECLELAKERLKDICEVKIVDDKEYKYHAVADNQDTTIDIYSILQDLRKGEQPIGISDINLLRVDTFDGYIDNDDQSGSFNVGTSLSGDTDNPDCNGVVVKSGFGDGFYDVHVTLEETEHGEKVSKIEIDLKNETYGLYYKEKHQEIPTRNIVSKSDDECCVNCEKSLTDCECEQCDECGEFSDDCKCERCGDCDELVVYCECDKCIWCQEKESYCTCDICEECRENENECSCD